MGAILLTNLELNLKLWLKTGLSDELDINKVFGIPNSKAEYLRTTWSVSTVGCSQSIPSTQTLEL
jgi:hypothetical protein